MFPPNLTVYLVAFACEPGRGSEPGVGWVFAQALAEASRRYGWRAVIVTRPHRLGRIRSALLEQGDGHVQVVTVGVPRLLRLRGARDVRLASLVWQWKMVRALRARISGSAGPVVVHHVTFATEGVPTFEQRLGDLAGLVFGPAGSTAQGGDRSIRRRLRRALGRPVLHRSDLLIATSEQVAASWRLEARCPVVVEPNIVVEPMEHTPELWDVAVVGQLIARKRVDVALQALALLGPSVRAVIVGDGPLRKDLESLRDELRLTERVEFLGAVSRDETLKILSGTRVLLHTSRQEGAGWVVGEAQAAGAFVVAIDGTGADDAARMGAGAIAASARPADVAEALRRGLSADRPEPSDRWSRARLPDLLHDWYEAALLRASRRRPSRSSVEARE